MTTKPLITIRATITRNRVAPSVLEIDTVALPANATPTQIAAAIDGAFEKLREAVREELLS